MVPASFPPSRRVAGTGRIPPASNAHLWFFGSIYVGWSESLGRYVVDCAATKARSGPTPPKPMICKGFRNGCRFASYDLWIDCLRRATTSRGFRGYGAMRCAARGWRIVFVQARLRRLRESEFEGPQGFRPDSSPAPGGIDRSVSMLKRASTRHQFSRGAACVRYRT